MNDTTAPEHQPRVSVVMIFLDAATYIADAIASVAAQSSADWELLLVDDGSTDGSSAIALDAARRDPARVRVIGHPGRANLGTAASRNLGIRAARAPLVAFLDADDVYERQRLARHLAVFDAQPDVGIVISHDLYWHSWRGGADGRLPPDERVGPPFADGTRIDAPRLLALTLATRGAPMPATCGITFRRDAALAAGPIPERFRDQYEDQVLIAQLLLTQPAVVLQDCLARYRQHPASLTAVARIQGAYRPGRAHEAQLRFADWLRGRCIAAGVHDPLLAAALRRLLWPRRHPLLASLRDTVRGAGKAARRGLLRVLPASLLGRVRRAHVRLRQTLLHRRMGRPAPAGTGRR
jgi:glycosyltransferase involved in cell wall biosynthesis